MAGIDARVVSTAPTYDAGQTSILTQDTAGRLRTTSGVDQTTPGTTNAVTLAGNPVTYTDRSGTVTSGGTAQVLMAALATRKGFLLQNQSAGDLWISSLGTAAATQPSLKIPAGGYYEPPLNGVPVAAISLFGAVTGQAFAAREW